MEEKTFKIRAYGFGELAQLYLPNILPSSASKRLIFWIRKNGVLNESLRKIGFQKGCRSLTPAQVKLIIEFLGEP